MIGSKLSPGLYNFSANPLPLMLQLAEIPTSFFIQHFIGSKAHSFDASTSQVACAHRVRGPARNTLRMRIPSIKSSAGTRFHYQLPSAVWNCIFCDYFAIETPAVTLASGSAPAVEFDRFVTLPRMHAVCLYVYRMYNYQAVAVYWYILIMYVGSCIHCFVVLRRFSAEKFQDKKFCLQCLCIAPPLQSLEPGSRKRVCTLVPWTSFTVSLILLAPRRNQSRRPDYLGFSAATSVTKHETLMY